MPRRKQSLRWLKLWSFGSFILAGLTGFSYRLALTGVDLFGLSLENIRHAHSHLMFFCWAVPLPMYLIIKKINQEIKGIGPNVLMTRMALFSFFLGLASFPFFLFYGYRPVTIAGMELPLSVIFSGLVMLSWYGFMLGYWKERGDTSTNLSLLFYDSALLMLFLASLGAWGVAVVQLAGFGSPLFGKALTHFFLATFTEGWEVLVLLGVLYEKLNINIEEIKPAPGLLFGLILFGAPLTFPYGISKSLLTSPMLLAARAGGLLAAAGLILNLYVIVTSSRATTMWYWKGILMLLGLKALAQLSVSLFSFEFSFSDHGLRILYLHLLLLGAFSLTLFTALARSKETHTGLKLIFGSVILVLMSLVLLTPLWPKSWFSEWQFHLVMTVALVPPLAGLYYLITLFRNGMLHSE